MEQVTRDIGAARHAACMAGGGQAGTPVLLLHGIGSNAASWQAQLQALGESRPAIAWNAPGYDASTPLPQDRPGPDDYADALAAFLERMEVGPCDLVGHSLGGLIAGRFVRRFPGRARRLVLSSPAGGYGHNPSLPLPDNLAQRVRDVCTLGPEGMAAQRAARTLSDTATPEMIARVQAAMAAVTQRGYTQATWLLGQGDLRADLRTLGAAAPPALVLCGTQDRVTPIAGVREIAACLQGASMQEIPGAGHASYAECPAAYNAALLGFLDDQRG